MGNELKFVLAFLDGLPEKEKGFIGKILDDFGEMGASVSKGLEVGSADFVINKSEYKLQDGLIITSAAYFNESLLNSGMTTIVYDKNLGRGLPYGIDLVVESFEEVDVDFLVKLWQRKNNIPCTIADTESIIIRELSESDIDEVVKVSRQEHIIKFVEDGRVVENEQKEKLLAYIRNIYRFYDYGIWGIFDKKNCDLIGLISIDLLNDTDEARYETGFFIRKERLGQGFAKEALEMVINYAKNKLSALELIAITDYDNKPAISLLEKCGFTVFSQNDKIIYVKQLEE